LENDLNILEEYLSMFKYSPDCKSRNIIFLSIILKQLGHVLANYGKQPFIVVSVEE
jgi:hypothetical protein